MTEQNYPLMRYTPKQVTAKKKPGMDSLINIVPDIKRDVKRVKSAITPQNAEVMIQKHNQSSPNSLWYLNKRDTNGPAVLANLILYEDFIITSNILQFHNENQIVCTNDDC